jgi:DNA-binding transcriptional LysR family regulator
MTSEPSWDHYRTLLAVLDAGSLSGGARRRGLSQPTAGRHIEQLEEALGAALFTRSPTGLRPTELALELRPHLEGMAAAAEAAARDAGVQTGAAAGVVRLTASEIMGVEVLPPILAEFRDLHPEVAIELIVSNESQDLLRREADIAVRTFRPTQGALLARRIGAVPVGLFAHRRYVERRGLPARLGEPGHAVIGFDRDWRSQQLIQSVRPEITREAFDFRADSQLAQLAAVRAGLGIGGCQLGLARRDPDLIPVLPDAFGFDLEVWVAMHEDLKASLRMRLMFDHLAAGLAVYVRTSQRQ